MSGSGEPTRVAFVAGTLGRGGAEQQLVYMVRALRERGVDVRVYSLTRGETHEASLRALGAPVTWVGRRAAPPARVAALARLLRAWRPQVVQSAHFYTNLHTALAARVAGALAVGAVRGDLRREMVGAGAWAAWSVRAAPTLVVNSRRAFRQARALGLPAERVAILDNVVDLSALDARLDRANPTDPDGGSTLVPGRVEVVAVGNLVPAKRFDRLLRALATARVYAPNLHATIVGDGPERPALDVLARQLGLSAEDVTFAGRRDDVTPWLRQADLFALTSDHEGTPNALLEAMGARLPALATDVGDVRGVVEHRVTGFVVPRADEAELARRLIELVRSPETRARLGTAGRARVEARHGYARLAPALFALYAAAASATGSARQRAGLGWPWPNVRRTYQSWVP